MVTAKPAVLRDTDAMRQALAALDDDGCVHARVAIARDILTSAINQYETHEHRARLSTRHEDILKLIAQGLRNRDIAKRLGIGEETVKQHVRTLMDRLGITNRTALALWAIRAGVISVNVGWSDDKSP